MSTRTYKNFAPAESLGDRVGVMPKSKLAELIQKAIDERDLTLREIARRSGEGISYQYIYDLKGGDTDPVIANNKIVALAKGLGESPVVVFLASIGKPHPNIRDETLTQMLEDFTSLPSRDRDELGLMIKMLRDEIEKRKIIKPRPRKVEPSRGNP